MLNVLRTIILYISLFLSLFLGYNADNLTATVNDTVTTETKEITVTIKNETRITTGMNGYYPVQSIEQNVNGEWKQTGCLSSVPEIAMVLYPLDKIEHTVQLEALGISSLSAGEYRLVIPYSADGHRTAYAYFTVA